MASNGTVAHRFANKDYNFERGLKGSSTHISGKNYYSYSTVFGQWVDENLCIVYWGGTSSTSQSHKLYQWNFPKDVVLLPYDDKWNGSGGYYSYYHGCDLLGWRGEFNFDKRVELIDYYVHEIYSALLDICGGKKKDLDVFAEGIVNEYWGYVMKLCSMYRDTTISKWLKIKRGKDATWSVKKKMVKELDAQNMDVKSLVDVMFGEGTWKTYYDYCARYRKAENNKQKMIALCSRLGISNTYHKYCEYGKLPHDLTAQQIRKLTAKERNEIHFRALAYKEYIEHEDERKEKYNRNFRNAYKWIVGSEPQKKYWGGGYEKDVHNNCINKDNGVVYECSGSYIFGFYWCDTSVSFDYNSFCNSEDKEQWIADFYAKCKEVALNRKAIFTLKRINAHTKEKANYYDDDVYLNDDYLRENTADEEYIICSEFIRKQDKYFADREARRRAEEIARLKREEEERKEKEYRAQVKREQIEKCLEDGVDGCRTLWYNHYTSIAEARQYAHNIDAAIPFFYGGNVLLRFGINKDKIESSKDIRVTIPTCKAMWKLVSKWHENPSSFKQMTIKTLDGTYTISSYKNDILTAGCHDIAYAEMERMYNEIVVLENRQ